jgi:hypothetical protein
MIRTGGLLQRLDGDYEDEFGIGRSWVTWMIISHGEQPLTSGLSTVAISSTDKSKDDWNRHFLGSPPLSLEEKRGIIAFN